MRAMQAISLYKNDPENIIQWLLDECDLATWERNQIKAEITKSHALDKETLNNLIKAVERFLNGVKYIEGNDVCLFLLAMALEKAKAENDRDN